MAATAARRSKGVVGLLMTWGCGQLTFTGHLDFPVVMTNATAQIVATDRDAIGVAFVSFERVFPRTIFVDRGKRHVAFV